MTTTIPPTPIKGCDSASLLAFSTATIPHTPTPANAPMTTQGEDHTEGEVHETLTMRY